MAFPLVAVLGSILGQGGKEDPPIYGQQLQQSGYDAPQPQGGGAGGIMNMVGGLVGGAQGEGAAPPQSPQGLQGAQPNWQGVFSPADPYASQVGGASYNYPGMYSPGGY